jgi:hypothetical protein
VEVPYKGFTSTHAVRRAHPKYCEMYSSSLIHMHSSCIETPATRCATLSSRNTSKFAALHNSSFRGGRARRELVIQMAATKEKKNADLERLTELLNAEETLVVAAVNYKGLSVRNAFLDFTKLDFHVLSLSHLLCNPLTFTFNR